MKNLKLLLLIIASISLLNSCGIEPESKDKTTNYPPIPTTSSSSQPDNQSKINVTPDLFTDYQASQGKLTKLLNERIVKNKADKINPKVRDGLTEELPKFREILEKIKNQKIDQKNIIDKIDVVRELINFKDLSSAEELEILQTKLGKEVDKEGEIFGAKTSKALIDKINEFGTELQPLKADIQVGAKASSSSEQKKLAETGFNWLNVIPPVLSLLSMIASGFAVYMAIDKTKKVKYRTANEIDKLRNSFDAEINAFRSKNQQLESNYTNLSHRIDRLDRLSQQQPGSYSPPPSYPQGRKTDDYRNDFNPIQSSNPIQNSNPIQSSNPRKNLPPAQPSFINEYNQNSGNFYTKYVTTEVLEEQYNIEGRRSGKVKTVNLSPAPKRTGGYWVFSQDNQYMLVPSSDVRINKFSLDTVDAMFDYSDFSSMYQKIRLVRPAIVEQNASGYQLVQRGRIEFE